MDGSVKVHKLDNFSYENLKNQDVDPFNGGITLSLNDQDCIVMNHNSLQIIVRKTTAPSKLKRIPILAVPWWEDIDSVPKHPIVVSSDNSTALGVEEDKSLALPFSSRARSTK